MKKLQLINVPTTIITIVFLTVFLTVFLIQKQEKALCDTRNYKLIDEVNTGYPRNSIAKPSPGVGGPCLSKDSFILLDSINLPDSVISSARQLNSKLPEYHLTQLMSLIDQEVNPKILIIAFLYIQHYVEAHLHAIVYALLFSQMDHQQFRLHHQPMQLAYVRLLAGVSTALWELNFQHATNLQ